MFNEMKETDGMKLLTIFAALLAAFAVGGGLALATGGGSSSGIDLTGNTGTTTEIGTTTGDDAGDISGPCDEAEHANDPRCTGAGVIGDSSGPGERSGRSHDDSGSDNSGPGSDNSGPGSDDSGSGSDGSGSGSDDSGDDD